MKKQFIACEVEDKIAILQIDNPPANALTAQVIKALDNTIGLLTEREDTKVIITGNGRLERRCFSISRKKAAGLQRQISFT